MAKQALAIPRLLVNGKRLASAVRSQMAGEGVISENRAHLEAAARWLMRAQEKGGGGFSRKYCLYGGWDKPYIETTGYLVPSMLAAGKFLGQEELVEGSKTAAYWLLGMQKESGAFCDTDTGHEQVFDTGQVLTGLITAYREWADVRFLDAAVRAGTWLARVQEDDGSWERFAYNRIKHSYYVKVSAALLALARETGTSRYHEAALKNIGWTLDCQEKDGYFRQAMFNPGEDPFLHTIVYVIEGLLDSYEILGAQRILEAAMRTVLALKRINRNRDMLLCSQYAEDWAPVNTEKCITGLAQWAGVALRVYGRTGDEDLRAQAIRTIYYLKSKQYLRPDQDLYGGLPGSVPFWGKYLGFCYPNWGLKFFIDALIAYEKYEVPLWREEEEWVSASFRFSESVVSGGVGPNDKKYIDLIEKEIHTEADLNVLDIGCGKGKFIKYFREKYPAWKITGIDPSFSDDPDIQTGSVYSIPAAAGSVDLVLLIEVMQHVGRLDTAAAELSRVVKPGGVLIIGDRDRLSIIGLMKPFIETAGRWMYPWDSPFRERWRSVREWKKVLGEDWRITFAQSFDNPDNRVPMSNRFYLLVARKKGQ